MPAVKMSDIRAKFPMYDDVPDDQLLIALHKKFYSDMPAGQFFGSVDFDTERKRLQDEATKGGGTLQIGPFDTGITTSEKNEQGAANFGAGLASLGRGVRQLASKVGIGSGPSDEDIREARARDEALARNTYGGRALQLAGEVVPTMVVPMAAYGRAVEALPAIAKTGPVTRLLTAGAAGGAANAALSPVTSDESRGANMAVAGFLGAALPGAGAAVPGVVRGARKLLTESGATQRAVEAITENMPERVRTELLDRLANYKPPTIKGAPVEVPTSATQATGDAHLAQAEAASRSTPSTQPGWADFDAARNAGKVEWLTKATPSEAQIAELAAQRAARAGPMYEDALAEATRTGGFAPPVLKHIDDTLASAASANPDARRLLNYARREIAEAPNDPRRMQVVLRTIREKQSGPVAIGDELGASVKGANAVATELGNVMDDALETAAKGKWMPAQGAYREMSKPITEGRSMRDIMEKIEAKPLLGTTPEVTYSGLSSAARRATGGKYGDKLQPEMRSDFDAYLDTLRQAEAASRTRKSAATMGGGSITNTDQQLANLTGKVIAALPGVGGYAKRVTEFNIGSVEREMARLLQSPTELGAALRALPPDRQQRVFDEALRASGLAGAESAMP